MRLQRCLRGEAEKAVKCLLVSPNNLQEILSTLETRFGKTQHIIDALVVKMMAIPLVRADRLETIVELGTAVTSLVSTIKTLKADSHLNNLHLVTEIERKLTPSMRVAWAEWVHADVARKKDLDNKAYWMKKKTAAICEICPPTVKDEKPENKGRGRAFAVTEQPKKTEKKDESSTTKSTTMRCNCCGGEGHLAYTCPVMKKMTVDERWKMVTEETLLLLPPHWSPNSILSYQKKMWIGRMQLHTPSTSSWGKNQQLQAVRASSTGTTVISICIIIT
jgi:hypothetical protein